MDRARFRIAARLPQRTSLMAATTLLLSTLPAAFQSHRGGGSAPSSPPSGGSDVLVDLRPQNKLRFPYGRQTFEKRENLPTGGSVAAIPGWQAIGAGAVNTTIVETTAFTQPGQPKRWLAVDDNGGTVSEGFITSVLTAPEPWSYSWTFTLRVVTAPGAGDAPVLAIQHKNGSTFADSWGVRVTSSGAELFTAANWGTPGTEPIFTYAGATNIGEWIQVRVVANLGKNTLTAFVNGVESGMLRTRPQASVDVTNLRLSYHGSGSGNVSAIQLDDVGVAFLNPLCQEDVLIDFTNDDGGNPLGNGQQIDLGQEFGNELNIMGIGGDGAVIFDTSNPGPNNPGQDLDLLVNQGNALIIQNDSPSNPPPVGDFYPRPNDDEDGGTLSFSFLRPSIPLSVDLIDMDAGPGDGAIVTLTDFSGNTRTYTVPTNWTGDITLAQPGVGTLDLANLDRKSTRLNSSHT